MLLGAIAAIARTRAVLVELARKLPDMARILTVCSPLFPSHG